MAGTHSKLSRLSESDCRRLDAWLDDFKASWHPELLRERVRSLRLEGDALRQAALEEMAQIDLRRQWDNGRRLPIEWYLATYPELGTRTTVSVGLLQAEYEAQRAVGETADVAEFAKRFPDQAEELRKLIKPSERVRSRTLVEDPRRSTDSKPSSTESDVKALHVPERLPQQFGRYRIIRRLGQGAMGAVFLAQDTQLGRQVALKVPRLRPEDGPEFLERFYREARAAATLDHPNLCSVYDVGQIDGIHYLTMAYLDGKPLSEFVDPELPLPERQVAAAVRKLAVALHEAHSHGVIHRDLKPSNIMINKRREPVVMDFGLARQMQAGEGRLTQSGMMMGSPAYMSPEQMSGDLEAMGPGCDIYSLGVILYELLTGRLPFDGSVASIMGQIMVKEPTPPSVYRPDLDPRLESICLKAMAKQVEDRYESMDAMAQALRTYLHGGDRSGGRDSDDALVQRKGFVSRKPGQETLAGRLFARLVGAARSSVLSSAHGRLGVERIRWPVWLVGAVVIGLLLGQIIYTSTNKGSIQVAFANPESASECVVRIDGHRIPVEELSDPILLRAGEHELLIIQGHAVVTSRTFGVIRGENAPLWIGRPDQQAYADLLKIPVKITNSVGMDLVLIPPGEFQMGSPDSDDDAYGDEQPQHRVRITKPFYLGRTEVTQGQWEAVMGTKPWSGEGYEKEGSNFAASCVSWEDAQEFCRRLSAKEGKTYRLPTEAEWEYTCRAGTTTAYCFGNDASPLSEYAWFDENADDVGEEYAHEVGLKKPNAFGIYDMHGNVWEWCRDWYDEDYYASSPTDDPSGQSAGSYRLYRGGSWFSRARFCRSAYRRGDSPVYRYYYLGFRLARSSVR